MEPEHAAFAKLWNEGRYFEAHEALEALWVRTRDRGQQGLIQMAAALHHVQRRNTKGARTMIDRALPRLLDAHAAPSPVDLHAMSAYARDLRAAIDAGNDLEAAERRPRL